jgi:hypothetical protein
MTPNQATQLFDVMLKLNTLATPELIAESARLRCPEPLTDQVKQRFRNQLSGAFALETLYAYRESLLHVNDVREELSRGIEARYHVYRQTRRSQPEVAAAAKAEAVHLRGRQESMFHFFAVCGMKFFTLLPMAASAAGHKISKAHREFLEGYEHLRHYYEHLDNEFPGKGNPATSVSESETTTGWAIRMGLPHDDRGRLQVRASRPPHKVWTVDVSRAGMNEIFRIFEHESSNIRERALAEVRNHFSRNPNLIPTPEEIKSDIIVQMNLWDDD